MPGPVIVATPPMPPAPRMNRETEIPVLPSWVRGIAVKACSVSQSDLKVHNLDSLT
jgi:hypothetical protein